MHFSAPSHPLMYAFLLQREEFQSRKIILETREQGEKLYKTLEALQEIQNTIKTPFLKGDGKIE